MCQCPKCGARNYYYPDKPIGTGSNYRNRCCVRIGARKLCGTPLVLTDAPRNGRVAELDDCLVKGPGIVHTAGGNVVGVANNLTSC